MASVKIILRNKKNSKGDFPLVVQIIKDRKSSLIFTGHYVIKKDWDAKTQKVRKSHPNSVRLNNLLTKKVSEVNQKMIESELEEQHQSAATLKDEVTGKANRKSFFVIAEAYLDNLEKSGKYNQHSASRPAIRHFKTFLGEDDIHIKNITPALLEKFKAYLFHERKVNKRTVMNNLVIIRTIFNRAITENPSLKKFYPFGRGKIEIKFPDTKKVGLNSKELEQLENLKLEPSSSYWHSRNLWLFSFYFAGMRISDVLKLTWNDLRDDRLHYAMSKNDKVGSLSIPSKALAIMNHYKKSNNKDGSIFPHLSLDALDDKKELYRQSKLAIKKINNDLKVIASMAGFDKPLTNHIARHTFGNLSGDKISPIMLQKLYRHSSLSTTIGYQSNFIHKDADKALQAVVGK